MILLQRVGDDGGDGNDDDDDPDLAQHVVLVVFSKIAPPQVRQRYSVGAISHLKIMKITSIGRFVIFAVYVDLLYFMF